MSKDFIDENGLVHHLENPTEESSENEIMFTSLFLILQYKVGNYFDFKMRQHLIDFFNEEVKQGKHMSHDNRTGLAAVRFNQEDMPLISLGNRVWLHPRDFVWWGWRRHKGTKKGVLFWLLLWIPSFFMILSCYQTYKVRDGKKIKKTDGKLLTWIRCQSTKMPLTFRLCTWLIKRNKEFGSWERVSSLYFKEEGHPIPELMRRWENEEK